MWIGENVKWEGVTGRGCEWAQVRMGKGANVRMRRGEGGNGRRPIGRRCEWAKGCMGESLYGRR